MLGVVVDAELVQLLDEDAGPAGVAATNIAQVVASWPRWSTSRPRCGGGAARAGAARAKPPRSDGWAPLQLSARSAICVRFRRTGGPDPRAYQGIPGHPGAFRGRNGPHLQSSVARPAAYHSRPGVRAVCTVPPGTDRAPRAR